MPADSQTTAAKPKADRNATARPATLRSRVTNGTAILPGVDSRSTWLRRLRDLIENHVSDMGGPEAISEAQLSLVRRAATLTVELERLEAKFAMAGEATPAELALYQTASNTLRRLLESIGLERRAKDITPSLSEYAASRSRRGAA